MTKLKLKHPAFESVFFFVAGLQCLYFFQLFFSARLQVKKELIEFFLLLMTRPSFLCNLFILKIRSFITSSLTTWADGPVVLVPGKKWRTGQVIIYKVPETHAMYNWSPCTLTVLSLALSKAGLWLALLASAERFRPLKIWWNKMTDFKY